MSNSYQLKITGAAELPEALQADKDLAIHAELSIYEVAKRDQGNGDFDIVYKAKIISAIDCIQGDKKIKSKDKTKASQKLRWAIEAKGRATAVEDLEVFYQSEMARLLSEYNKS